MENGNLSKISLPVTETKCEMSDSLFFPFPGKNDLHIGVLAGFRGSGWDKLRGKNSLDLTVIGGL